MARRGWIRLDPRAGMDDELYTEWWDCPARGCKYGRILRSANYCPGCGKKIQWDAPAAPSPDTGAP